MAFAAWGFRVWGIGVSRVLRGNPKPQTPYQYDDVMTLPQSPGLLVRDHNLENYPYRTLIETLLDPFKQP